MALKARLINGGIYKDDRGALFHANDFNLSGVKRMYHIHQSDTGVIRGWQGHQKEQKWFHCIQGSFIVKLIEIDDWSNPSCECEHLSFVLSDDPCQVLHIPGGYANGFKALEENSIMMVFSDKEIQEAKHDDYRFETSYWNFKWN